MDFVKFKGLTSSEIIHDITGEFVIPIEGLSQTCIEDIKTINILIKELREKKEKIVLEFNKLSEEKKQKESLLSE